MRWLCVLPDRTGSATPMLASAPENQGAGTAPADAAPLAADVFPGDALEGATTVSDSTSARAQAARHGWRVLAILSALMGFASILRRHVRLCCRHALCLYQLLPRPA